MTWCTLGKVSWLLRTLHFEPPLLQSDFGLVIIGADVYFPLIDVDSSQVILQKIVLVIR